MRLPKAVNICGKTYSVKKDRKIFGGHGETVSQTITVGSESKVNERHFETFLHEVMECIACERGNRYGKGISEDSVFVMSHKEFDNFVVDVSTAIFPMVKK